MSIKQRLCNKSDKFSNWKTNRADSRTPLAVQ